MTSTEHVIATEPFTVRRRVKWSDCDPAGVVYTVVFGEYVISAAELFYGFLFGTTPQRAKDEQGFGTPSGALSMRFHRSLWPDEEFDIAVRVGELRRSSYVLHFSATLGGESVFEAELTPICVARSERKAIPIPPAFRAALARHQAHYLPGQ
jgi:4-hydroxybenzoyl-CoA thioesterase